MTTPRRTALSQPTQPLTLPDHRSLPQRQRRLPDPPPGASTEAGATGNETTPPRKPLLLARQAAPADLFSPDAWQMVLEKLPERVAYCQQRLCGFTGWFYGRESEPFWGQNTTRCCSGTALRGLRMHQPRWLSLRDVLGLEVERVARLMVEPQPGHGWAEGLASLLGALRRMGQVYRELRWRCGERQALKHLADLLFTLPP